MTRDEIRLVLPAEESFRPVAHLVAGGLALRLDPGYEELEDLQVALDALLGLRDDAGELVVVLAADGDVVRAELGPFAAGVLEKDEPQEGRLDLRCVLETVCDTFEVEQRADGAWVQLTKRIARAAPAGA